MSDVVVLGGAGIQGGSAAKVLSRFPGVERVILADRDTTAAEAVAAECGAKAVVDKVDAHDPSDVARVLRHWTPRVVLNAVGPYRRFGAGTLEAAIESGVDYVDLLDDAEVVESYYALDDAARAKGVTAVFGVGFTPGLTNIMARYLADELDAVDEIHWTYLVNGNPFVPSHLWAHRVQMYAADARIVRDGELVAVPGGSDAVDIEWKGMGTLPASVCTHPEPMCAHHYYKDLKHSTIRGCYTSPEFLNMLSVLGNAGFGDAGTFTVDGHEIRADVAVGEFLNSEPFRNSLLCKWALEAEEKYGEIDGVRVAVSGRRNGQLVRRVLQNTHKQRWFTTHTTAAVGAGLMATGHLNAPGVHSAEVFDPKPTLEALRDAGIEIEEVDAATATEFVES